MRQVLVNILANAVKFTHVGEVALSVGVEAEYLDTATLRFRIKDTGIGFAQDKAPFLFTPFVQADGSMTRRFGGTGLGLTISKQLVEMMGGRIGAHSAPGAGSAFWFTIAFEKRPQPASAVKMDFSLQSPNVLIVDDNPTNRMLVQLILQAHGCRTDDAEDADAALAKLHEAVQAEDPFGVAFLDWKMPGTDGRELGKRIASDAALNGTALLLMTPLGGEIDTNSLGQIGFAGSLSKPIWESSLLEALKQALAGRSYQSSDPKEIDSTPLESRTTTQTARILVVEDNATNQQVSLAILQKYGHQAHAVWNGAEALEALRQDDYDMVLMDCEMPVMDGFEATHHIRENSTGVRNPDIPIIAMTAHAMQGDREKCIAAKMNDYLSKPIEPDQIAEILPKWLPRSRSRGQVRVPATSAQTGPKVVFEPKKLVGRLSGDEALARTIVAGFLSDAPGQFQKLRQRIEQGDTNGARAQAHSLKGASATVSAPALRDLFGDISQAVKDGELSHAAALLPRVNEQFELLRAALSRIGWV